MTRKAEQRNKNKLKQKDETITCPICVELRTGDTVPVRYFASVDAMRQHCQAKHNRLPPL